MAKLPLKLRATLVALDEAIGLGATVNGIGPVESQSAPVPLARVGEYHSGAVRDGQPLGAAIGREHANGQRYYDFCASAIGWAEHQAQADGDRLPPWRLGSYSELWQQDALSGLRGAVVTIDQVRAGTAYPTPGSIAVFARGGWKGHVERVISSGSDAYLSVGANEGGQPGRWGIEWRGYDDPQLVGFCECDPLSDDELTEFGRQLEMWRGDRLTGFDLSHHNTALVEWPQLAIDHQFCIMRATYGKSGKTWVDSKFREFVAGARAGLFAVGVYAWIDQRFSIAPQISRFVEVAAPHIASGDIVPHLDVEAPPGTKFDPSWWRANLPIAIERVVSEFGGAGIYGNAGDLQSLGDGPWSDLPLWVAHYTTAPAPRVPPQWDSWTIWQRRAATYPTVPGGRTIGYGGGKIDVDLNVARKLPLLP